MHIDNALFLLILQNTPIGVHSYTAAELHTLHTQYSKDTANDIRRLCVTIPVSEPPGTTRTYYIERHADQFRISQDGPVGARAPLAVIPICEPDFDRVIWQILTRLASTL